MSMEDACSHATVTCVKVTGGTQHECASSPIFVAPNTNGVTAKIPVTLAELEVQINLDSVINLPEPALEIKDIHKKVKVTQSLLVHCGGLQLPPVLFIKGFIRKNIDYATRDCSNAEGVCGDIRHCTVDVPFRCTTNVNFNGVLPTTIQFNSTNELSFLRSQSLSGPGFAEKDQLQSGDLSEFNLVNQEFFNELPYCELVSARIVEYDEFLNRTRPAFTLPFEEKEFRQVEEKAVLFLTLKILQDQLVAIPPCELENFGCIEFQCPDGSFTCTEPFNCLVDFVCPAFGCLDPYNCGSDYDCGNFNCVDPFGCGEPFDCGKTFTCAGPYDCVEPFDCGVGFSCADPFTCVTSEFACDSLFGCIISTFDCTDPFNCGKNFNCATFDCADPFGCIPFNCGTDFECTDFECTDPFNCEGQDFSCDTAGIFKCTSFNLPPCDVPFG